MQYLLATRVIFFLNNGIALRNLCTVKSHPVPVENPGQVKNECYYQNLVVVTGND
jgi:hypothetical protein